jgi:hypothetical protein
MNCQEESHVDLSLNATFLDGSEQGCMIAFSLICVHLSEEGNCLCKQITAAQVATDLGRVAAARVRSCKGHGTQPGVGIELFLRQSRIIRIASPGI